MSGAPSMATRVVAWLVIAVVLASTTAGVAAASSSVDSGLPKVTKTIDNTTDSLENATNDSGSLDDGGDASINETTDSVDSTVDETTTTVNGTIDTVDSTVDGTAIDASLEAAVATGGRDSRTGGNGSTDDGPTAANADDGGGSDGSDSSGSQDPAETAADAVLVGVLGVITASGAAAGGSSASGAAGGASTATAGWLRTLREMGQFRRAGTDFWKLAPLFRYSQYDDSDPLEHDGRRTIYETVRDEPGCYLSQVSERTGIPLSTVRYHVRVLEDEDLLTGIKHNGKRRYFLEDDDAELRAALSEPAKREVLETLAELGRAHNGRLADALERDPSTVSHHLSALEDDGLVVREKDGRSIVNELSPRVEAALGDETPSATDATAAPADD